MDSASPASSSSSTPATEEQLAPSGEVNLLAALRGNPLFYWGSQIVLWRHPIESGLYCGILNLYFLLLTLGEYSSVTLLAYLLLSFLLLCALYVHSSLFKSVVFENKASAANPLDEWASTPIVLTTDDVEQHVSAVLLLSNTSLNYLRRIYTLQDKLASLQFGLGLFFLGLFGRLFSTSFLCHLLTIFLFSFPLAYQKHHSVIDAQLAKISGPLSSLVNRVAAPKPKAE